MLFTSLEFVALLAVVLPLYYSLQKNHQAQNVLLLIASYVFYGWWDWRFLFLLLFSTALDYCVGLALHSLRDPLNRRLLLTGSIVLQILLLGVFKYYNFFADSLADVFAFLGLSVSPPLLNIVLPVGISFYTFHTISYTVDIYRRVSEPTRDFIGFALFISFFPQLVAGPIARASHLLPQCLKPRVLRLEDVFQGVHLFYWGLFKKVVVADNLGVLADGAFSEHSPMNFSLCLIGSYAFAFQIYCDFSGYSDMARGCSKWMGFDLQINFDAPYFSIDPSDFWKRWHISLSSWLRDYLYIPLGGNRNGTTSTCLNLLLTMVIGGLWHGANWTFVLWGAFHGIILIIYRLLAPNLSANRLSLTSSILHRLFFFHLVCFSWILFRSEDLSHFLRYICGFIKTPVIEYGALARVGLVIPVLIVDYLIFIRKDQLALMQAPWWIRGLAYCVMYWLMVSLGKWAGDGFIYFQF